MQIIFFAPALVYGLSLAIQGDFLLLVISVTTVVIWILPRFLESNKPSSNPSIELAKWPEPPLGKLVSKDESDYWFPPCSKAEIVAINLSGLVVERFFESFVAACSEEFWLVGDPMRGDFMQQVSMNDEAEELMSFVKHFKRRAEVPLALNLVVTNMQAAFSRHELSDLFSSTNLNYRIFYLGENNRGSGLDVEKQKSTFKVLGSVSGLPVEFYFAELPLAGEEANNRSDEGLTSGGTLNNIGYASSQHGTSGGNKPKWLNFPAGRAVVDKGQSSEVGLISQNQIRHGSSRQIGSPDAVADITTRLANLGHRIEPD
jgi:hypothetical protein